MRRLHITGRKNHGKTTLVVELAAALSARGLRVGTIKHSPHRHELDTPGKDSWRHRAAGARPAGIVTPEVTGVYVTRLPGEDVYDTLEPLYAACDLVLVEGDHEAAGVPKVEVWRAANGTAPIASERSDIAAVVTDDACATHAPRWPRRDAHALAERVLRLLGLPSDPVPAYVLAGGRSRRFGSDKARATVRGRPALVNLADQLQPWVSRAFVVADVPGKYDDLGLVTIADAKPGLGPMGGLLAAIEHRGEGWLLLAPCDLVTFRPEWLAALLDARREGLLAAAFRAERWVPLPALYHTSLLPVLRDRLHADDRSLWRLIESVPHAQVPLPPDWPAVAQFNTPQEWDQACADAGPL